MNRLCIIVFAGLLACTRDGQLHVSDLKFPDPQRTNSKLKYVDTAFIYDSPEYGNASVFYQTFDREGRIICDSTQPYMLLRSYYDSIGLLVRRERIDQRSTWIDSLTYKFDPDSLILEQRWTSSRVRYLFYFNEKGKLLQSLKFEKDSIPTEESRYTYDGDLLTKLVFEFGPKNRIVVESNFFYSPSGMLDSSTLKTDYGHTQSWNYDSIGLLANEWSNGHRDRRLFVYKMKH